MTTQTATAAPDRETTHARLGLVVMILATGTAIVGLHALGGQTWARVDVADPGAWLLTTPAPDVVLALVRIVALACAYWLAASTLVAVGAAAGGAPHLLRLAARTAPAAVRRLAERAVVAAAVGGVVLGTLPAAAAPAPPGLAPPPDRPAAEEVTPPTTAPAEITAPRGPAAEPSARLKATYEVVSGDHLWSIASRVVASRQDRDASELTAGEVASYWVRLVEENRGELRSGDPNLIYPGETIRLVD